MKPLFDFDFLIWKWYINLLLKNYHAKEKLNRTAIVSESKRTRQRQPTPVLLPGKSHGQRSLVGCSPWGREVEKSQTWLSDFTFTFHFHALEKEMATHSSVLAWRIPGTGEPGGLPSMGSHRVEHDWSDLAAAAAESKKTLYVRIQDTFHSSE